MYPEPCVQPSPYVSVERRNKRPYEVELPTFYNVDDDLELPEEVRNQVDSLRAKANLSNSLQKSAPNKRRRIVRFLDTDKENEGRHSPCYQQQLNDLPISKLTLKEIRRLWIQKADYRTIFSSAMKQAKSIRAEARKQTELTYFTCYSDALANTYYQCCNQDKNRSTSSKPISLDQVAFLSLFDSSSRGLESQTLPKAVSFERHSRRTMTIKTVLKLQRELRASGRPEEDLSEYLRVASEYYSKASRKFARVLGEVDGTSAMFDYEIYNVGTELPPSP